MHLKIIQAEIGTVGLRKKGVLKNNWKNKLRKSRRNKSVCQRLKWHIIWSWAGQSGMQNRGKVMIHCSIKKYFVTLMMNTIYIEVLRVEDYLVFCSQMRAYMKSDESLYEVRWELIWSQMRASIKSDESLYEVRWEPLWSQMRTSMKSKESLYEVRWEHLRDR